MDEERVRIWLSPRDRESYTRFGLCGSPPVAVPRRKAVIPVRGLAFWSGAPGECALCVDGAAARWCEWWTDPLADMSGRHLEVRYRRVRSGDAR